MDDDELSADEVGRLMDGASSRVAAMTDQERVALFNCIAGRMPTVTDRGFRSSGTAPYGAPPREDVGKEVARLTAQLRRTERRLDHMDRGSARSRYQMSEPSGRPSARYSLLVRRADRIERRLRALLRTL